jgi:hypothetical protein
MEEEGGNNPLLATCLNTEPAPPLSPIVMALNWVVNGKEKEFLCD